MLKFNTLYLFQLMGGVMQMCGSGGPLWFNMTCGSLSSGAWYVYNMFTNCLAFNRFIVMAHPHLAPKIFGSSGTKVQIFLYNC